jgi:hypothetical protein
MFPLRANGRSTDAFSTISLQRGRKTYEERWEGRNRGREVGKNNGGMKKEYERG